METLSDRLREMRRDLELSSSYAASPTGMRKSASSVGGPSGKSPNSMPMSARSKTSRASLFRKRRLEMSTIGEKESVTPMGNSTIPIDHLAIPMDISPTSINVVDTRAVETGKETADTDAVMMDVAPEVIVTER